MKKCWHRICSLILIIAMMVNFLPLNALAENPESCESTSVAENIAEEEEILTDKDYSDARIVEELVDNRTEFSKAFLTDSGIGMAVVYGSAVHYEKDGKWEEIDNTLKVNSNQTITNTAGVWDVSFPQRMSSTNQIQINKDGYTLSFGMAGELRKQGNLEVMSIEPIPNGQTTETEDANNTEEPLEITEAVESITDTDELEDVTLDEQETALDIGSEESPSSEVVLAEDNLSMTPMMAALEENVSEITEETTAPEETASEESIPEETEPETTVPEDVTPETAVPDETITPEETDPETTPEDATTESTVPTVTEPEMTIPEETVPINVLPSLPTTSITIDGVAQTFAISSAKFSQAQIKNIDIKKALDATEHPEAVLTKPVSQLMYEDVYSNADIQYDLVGNQVKESIILQSYDSNIRGYQFALNTGDLIPVLDEDGHIDLYDPSRENIIMTMPAPFLQDSEMAHTDEIRVILSGSDGKYTLTYILPLQWLADEERAWPVILDPVISASPDINNIHDVTVGSIYSYDYQVGVLEAGVDRSNGVQRFFVKYGEIPELSSSDVILGAVVRMYKPYSFSSYRTVEAHKVLENWENYSMTWANQPDCDPIVEDYVRVKNEGFYYFDVTDVVRDWYTEGNYGLMFKAPNTAEEQTSVVSWVQFYSCNFGAETVSPNLFVYFRNNNGIEGYWDYTTSSAGRAGTGYVNQHTGNLTWVHNDIGFGGNRMPVSISHIYNTNDKSATTFGVGAGWRTNFNQRVYRWDEDSDYRIWEDADGTKHYFEYESYGVYKDEDGLELTLTNTGSGNSTFCITDKNGNKSYFDNYGRLRKQENNQKTSSSINITYTTSSGYLIQSVTDGVGRKYNFAYTDGLLSRISYVGTGTEEISYISYGYTGSDLTSIHYKDGKSATITYDSNHLLTAATDIDGYELRYTYNTTTEGLPSRISSVSEFDGSVPGGSMTFEYAHNQTTLTDNNGNVQILQFNDFGNTVSIQDGEGHAQYAKYAKNDSEETGKGNQLRASSKMQNTVSSLLADGNFEDRSLWPGESYSLGNGGYLGSRCLVVFGERINLAEFSIAPGESYAFSAYVLTGIGEGELAFYENENRVAVYDIPVCNDWTRVQVSYTNTSDAVKTLTAAMGCTGGDVVFMVADCVQIEKAPTASRYNIVQNGDFRAGEVTAQGWTEVGFTEGDGLITLETSAAPQLDAKVIKIEGSPESKKSLGQTIPISGSQGDTYVVTGWGLANAVPFKEENQPDDETREFGIRLTFNYTDDENSSSSEVAQFNAATNATANWQYSSAVAVAEKAYSSVTVEAVYDHNANIAYFDGIQLYKEEFSQSYDYDDDGNVISVIDLQKQKTEYEYTDNDLTKQIIYDGDEARSTYTYTYDDYHNVLTATTEKGVQYKFEYDDYGNNTSVEIIENGVSIKSTATYSDNGNHMVSATDATGKTTQYGYNADTNVLEWVQYPEDEETTRTNYTYDSMYRMATAAATTDTGLSLSAEYTYTDDLLTAIETPRSTYSFSYGDFALRSNVTIGNRTLASYEYTSRNHYLSSLDYGNEDEVQYTYDNLGRVTHQTYEDGATVDYRYDNNGALATVTDSATGRTTTYYYDFIDRMMKYVESGEGYNHSVGYEYDTINNLTKLVETINGTTHTTAYTYDDDNRITKVDTGSASKDYTYDGFGRASQQVTKNGSSTIKTDTFAFKAPSNIATSSQITSHTIDSAGLDIAITYTYDDNGNILSASGGGYTVSYVYDSANQLVRENNGISGKTRTWTYDNAGNILDRKEYAYTTGTLGAIQNRVNYIYGDSSWGDLLTEYNGQSITYDGIGNPLTDGTWTYAWQHGRQLASMAKSGTTWNFTYNADGLRTKRTNGATTYSYIYNGDKLSQMTVGSDTLTFSYDASGTPMTVQYRGTTYYYVTNIQGDVMAILNGSGAVVVAYFYDAWGNHLGIYGDMANTLGTANPLRYRGYVYDHEYGLYYLQSRYYNPDTGRFLNADAFAATGQGLLGNNMFTYCNNNASNCSDSFGMRPVSILERFGDTTIPAPPLKVKTTKRDVTAEINSALNTKRMDAIHQRIANDLLFDTGYPQIGGLGGIVIELVEDAPLYIAFYNAVNHEEEWDIKRKDPWEKTIGTSFPGFDTEVLYEGNIMTPEDLGNYTYGSIGKAYGFPLVILYVGSYYAAGFPVGEDFWNNEWKDWGYITKGYFR